MTTFKVRLPMSKNIQNFVAVTQNYPYEIDLIQGRHNVNGQSLLGIFSLDLSKDITVVIYSDD